MPTNVKVGISENELFEGNTDVNVEIPTNIIVQEKMCSSSNNSGSLDNVDTSTSYDVVPITHENSVGKRVSVRHKWLQDFVS